jgi:hypothetical protein
MIASGAATLIADGNRGKAETKGWLASETSTSIAEKQLRLGCGIVMRALDQRHAKPMQPMLDVGCEVEHEMPGF